MLKYIKPTPFIILLALGIGYLYYAYGFNDNPQSFVGDKVKLELSTQIRFEQQGKYLTFKEGGEKHVIEGAKIIGEHDIYVLENTFDIKYATDGYYAISVTALIEPKEAKDISYTDIYLPNAYAAAKATPNCFLSASYNTTIPESQSIRVWQYKKIAVSKSSFNKTMAVVWHYSSYVLVVIAVIGSIILFFALGGRLGIEIDF